MRNVKERFATGRTGYKNDWVFANGLGGRDLRFATRQINTPTNEQDYSASIREKFHKLFLRENPQFVKHPPAQSRVANFRRGLECGKIMLSPD